MVFLKFKGFAGVERRRIKRCIFIENTDFRQRLRIWKIAGHSKNGRQLKIYRKEVQINLNEHTKQF